MHSYTPEQVAADGFDLNLIKMDETEIVELIARISKVRSDAEKKKRSGSASNSYVWVSDEEVINSCQFLNKFHYLSMVFYHDLCNRFSEAISGNGRYMSWYLGSRLGAWVSYNPVISKKLLLLSGTQEFLKFYIVNNNIVQIEDLIESIKSKAALSFPLRIQEQLLEMSDPADSITFIESDHDKIRLLAYQKIGPLSYLDEMIKDPHAMIRKYAVRLLSPGDQRLASFINDRSQDVFIQALSKISASLIPMMLGSSHLKKKRAKEVLNNRLQASQD
jgi:hypothetical protein